MSIVSNAEEFAAFHHRNQAYGDHGYFYHLRMVANLVEKYEYNHNENLIAAAYLHDILEDTDVTLLELVEEFGIDIAHLVWCVTDEPGKNRAERHKNTYPKIHKRMDAIRLKIYDRIANLQHCIDTDNISLLKMYTKEYSDFYHEFVGWAADWEEWWELETLYTTAWRMVEDK